MSGSDSRILYRRGAAFSRYHRHLRVSQKGTWCHGCEFTVHKLKYLVYEMPELSVLEPIWLKYLQTSMSGIAGATCSLATLVVTSFVSGFLRTTCVCECPGEKDSPVLQLLQSQLDRCGPEHLNGVPCREASWQVRAFEWVFCFTIGVLTSQLVGYWLRTWQASRERAAQETRREIWGGSFGQQCSLDDAEVPGPRWHPGPRSAARRVSG